MNRILMKEALNDLLQAYYQTGDLSLGLCRGIKTSFAYSKLTADEAWVVLQLYRLEAHNTPPVETLYSSDQYEGIPD